MQYALIDGRRREAIAGARGVCATCNAEMVSKCGPRVMHHWAHARKQNCDPWWENETPWHREWKNLFPPECREICHIAPDGEVHRSDIKTPTGIVIEVQHSAMTDAERSAREEFYGNLIWVVDGRCFRKNFDIYHLLPDPASDLARDLVWFKATRPMQGAAHGLFWRLSENPGSSKTTNNGVWIHGIGDIEDEVNAAYRGHHQYDWVRPRKTWLDATCPVYIDFGDEGLVRLEIYDESGLTCVRRISKRKFLHDVMVETLARAIGTRFYPIG